MPVSTKHNNMQIRGDLSRIGIRPEPEPSYDPIPTFLEEPVLLGKENLPPEEKARLITDEWMNGVTRDEVRKMKAGEIRKISEIAGIGQKKETPVDNPIILAIIAALSARSIAPPAMDVTPLMELSDGK